MTSTDTSSFFTSHQTRDVPRDQWGRYKLPGPDGEEKSWTRATTFAATLAEQYALRIWEQRQVVWGLARRPDLITMASTISGPEDKKALGEIVDEAHIAGGTKAKANRGTAIHRACQAAERGAYDEVPEELRPHVSKYFTAMREGGLTILPEYVERTGIVNQYDTAGTFDNLVRCPDGKIRVSDKKTGRMDYSDTEFAVQLAVYAHFDALFNYDTGRYEPMPEVATDYAILTHIDPETGDCELMRINIEWGWLWARTCAEVMAIRKTKGAITPYVPPEQVVADVTDLPPVPAEVAEAAQIMHSVNANANGLANTLREHAGLQASMRGPIDNSVALVDRSIYPVGVLNSAATPGAFVDTKITVPVIPTPGEPFTIPADPQPNLSEIQQRARQQYGDTAQLSVSRSHDGTLTATVDPSSVLASLPDGSFVEPSRYNQALAAGPMVLEYQAFWSDDRHDLEDDEPTGQVNGVPLAQYGQPSPWGCSRGEPCEFTGTDGLHSDGTVCLYGNARPGPIPPLPAVEHTPPSPRENAAIASEGASEPTESEVIARETLAEVSPIDDTNIDYTAAQAASESNVDAIAKAMNKLPKGSAQDVARKVMAAAGVAEGKPGSIKLSQYKSKVINETITMAHRHSLEIPGAAENDPPFGTPSGPAPGASGAKPSAAAQSPDDQREEKIRTAVESIRQQNSINGLQERHAYYSGTSIGWTDEMQSAARTRAAELEAETGESPLTPMEMIQGATSRETLTKAWDKATEGGANQAGWTEALNAAAMAKQTELSAVPA